MTRCLPSSKRTVGRWIYLLVFIQIPLVVYYLSTKNTARHDETPLQRRPVSNPIETKRSTLNSTTSPGHSTSRDTNFLLKHANHVITERSLLKPASIHQRAAPANYSFFSGDTRESLNKEQQQDKDCLRYSWDTPTERFYIKEDLRKNFVTFGNVECYSEGVDKSRVRSHSTTCPCLPGWHGVACSIPNIVIESNIHFLKNIVPRLHAAPRKIINAFLFNVEFETLEARFGELYDVVDVFLILESNYTFYGDPKPLLLLDRLRRGYYNKYACKIVHVFLDVFPKEGYDNGWAAQDLPRKYLSSTGLQQLRNYNDDDIYMFNDADELPMKETVLFIRLHDGYPFPVNWLFRTTLFGYFWRKSLKPDVMSGAVTIGLLLSCLNSDGTLVRSNRIAERNDKPLMDYLKKHPKTVIHTWAFGTSSNPAGWHCSWCGHPEAIQIKLMSAPNCDFPRWGDYPEKCKISYIKYLIQKGMFFDEKGTFLAANMSAKHFAPAYILNNRQRYKHILINQYKIMDESIPTGQ